MTTPTPVGTRHAQTALYGAGEYSALSATLAPAARALVDAAGVGSGCRVLDVGTGDGTVASLATLVGAAVTACDVVAVQARRAAERVPGLAVVVADAQQLPFGDGTFDHVLSSFAAVYAPDPETCIAELFRVCRRGGTVAVTAWPPDSMLGELNQAVREAAPDPAAFPDPELEWGVPDVAAARMAAHAASVTTELRWFAWDPVARAAAGAADCGARYLAAHLPDLDLSEARARIAAEHTVDGVLRADYLLAVGRKPA